MWAKLQEDLADILRIFNLLFVAYYILLGIIFFDMDIDPTYKGLLEKSN